MFGLFNCVLDRFASSSGVAVFVACLASEASWVFGFSEFDGGA